MMFRRGANGPEVRRIEQALARDGLYTGTIDGIFGGGVESAVRNFQKLNKLDADGVVGDATWQALIGEEKAPRPAIAGAPVEERCLALTGSFETSSPVPECFCGLSGNFDGQGLSFGALQWNFGQGSLPPLLDACLTKHPDVMETVFGPQLDQLTFVLKQPRDAQIEWAASICIGPKAGTVMEPWRGLFRALGRTEAFQAIELDAVSNALRAAKAAMSRFQVRSERALALLFDIMTQNGSIDEGVGRGIRADYARIPTELGGDELEVERLLSIANRRADAAKPAWRDDVRTRKLTIARGKGEVHGNFYDLEAQYGLTLAPLVTQAAQ